MKMGLESRPRSKSYKFDIELGSLMLKDKVKYIVFVILSDANDVVSDIL